MEVYFFHQLREMPMAPVEGKVVGFEKLPAVFERPLVRKAGGNILAFESGGRCNLVPEETATRFYKIKGGDPSTKPFDDFYDPTGGQRYSSARTELDNAAALGDLFEKEGLVPAYRPVGYFLYDMKFTHPQSRETERLAGSLFEISGDTRLGDFIGSLIPMEFWLMGYPEIGGSVWLHAGMPDLPLDVYEHVTPEVSSVLEKFGVWAGYLKRIMDSNNYTWTHKETSTNAHIRNFVMLGEGNGDYAESVSLGMVDFDRSKRWGYEDKEAMKQIQEFEFNHLAAGPSYWKRGFEAGYHRKLPQKISLTELQNAGLGMDRLIQSAL